VVGVSEAAFLMAWTLGRRYTIVAMTKRLGTWYRECAIEHGLDSRLVSVRALDVPVPHIASEGATPRPPRGRMPRGGRDEDAAEVVIFGGGPIAGLAREAAAQIPVPALDGVSCGVRLAEALVGLAPRPATRGSFARPASKPTRGLSPFLGKLIDFAP